MEKIRYSGTMSKVLLAVILTLASMLAFVLYHVVVSPRTTTYGVGNDVNVSVKIDPSGLLNPPKIIDISPLTGPVGGGTLLTITGSDLDSVIEVALGGGLKCEPITHISPSEITCVTPPSVAGYVNVTVISSGYGSDTKENGFRYLSDGTPGVPNTGLFRLGKHIITLYDLLVLAAVVIAWLIALWLVVWRQARRDEADKRA
ncbi:IPT/TIG domain-containing protein [Candidatus Saccharibacteria bacterium]|nr:IPT/TIG domain-containing protein [Candidatus Saccharibacteria bacterium]